MFLHNFVMKGLLGSIGNMPNYWIINSALSWYEKGVLTENDLEEINSKIEEREAPEVVEVPEEVVEEENIENV